MTHKYEVATRMAKSLLNQARIHNVDLSGLTIENFNCYLDDAFNDGGEVRCVKFIDLSDRYSTQFGPLESKTQINAQWECIELAIQKIHQLNLEKESL